MNLLCRFAHRFPLLAAEILNRDRHKNRNFREETITDILMAGLVPFEPFDILTNYPVNEAHTGEDMDWEFVNEHAVDGRKYLRLHIQAKRAHKVVLKKSSYWLYRELDHATGPKQPKAKKGTASPPPVAKPNYGTQHKALVNEAKKIVGCVPLYMFYHPTSALQRKGKGSPAVEGVNWMFADLIPENESPKRWPTAHRKLDKWRPHFHPLSDLLCRGHGPHLLVQFLIARLPTAPTPGEIEERLNQRRDGEDVKDGRLTISAAGEIPKQTLEIIQAARRGERKAAIERPRVIFVSGLCDDA